MREVLHIIAVQCSRIRFLDIHIETDAQRKIIIETFRHHHPRLLKHFRLHIAYIESQDNGVHQEYEPGSISLGGAPGLRSVQLEGCGLKYCQVPLQAVTDLTLNSQQFGMKLGYNALVEVLKGAPLLSSLAVVGGRGPLTYTYPGQPEFVYDHLKHLHSHSSALALASCITTPALETLHIDLVSEEDLRAFIESLSEATAARYPALSTLYLDHIRFPDAEACSSSTFRP